MVAGCGAADAISAKRQNGYGDLKNWHRKPRMGNIPTSNLSSTVLHSRRQRG